MSWELVSKYEDMELGIRIEACRMAEEQGRQAAAADMGAASGIDTETATVREYLVYVVEPMWQADTCTDAELAYWKDEAERNEDPRIAAFAKGWAHEVALAREEIDRLAEEIS